MLDDIKPKQTRKRKTVRRRVKTSFTLDLTDMALLDALQKPLSEEYGDQAFSKVFVLSTALRSLARAYRVNISEATLEQAKKVAAQEIRDALLGKGN